MMFGPGTAAKLRDTRFGFGLELVASSNSKTSQRDSEIWWMAPTVCPHSPATEISDFLRSKRDRDSRSKRFSARRKIVLASFMAFLLTASSSFSEPLQRRVQNHNSN